MTRLTTKQYLRAHRQLRHFWHYDNRLYSELTSIEQWQLHDYFQPAKDLTDDQLLAHRERLTKERPNLPHEAGRALSKFQASTAQLALLRVRTAKVPLVAGAGRRNRGKRKLTVKAVVRPEIDVEKLARAFLNVAETRVRRRAHQAGQTALGALVESGFTSPAQRLPAEIQLILRHPGLAYWRSTSIDRVRRLVRLSASVPVCLGILSEVGCTDDVVSTATTGGCRERP